MKLNYYVLWKKDNEMLSMYLEKYYLLLLSYLREILSYGILKSEISNLLKIENKEFILDPDQSAIINLIYKEIIKKEPQYLWDYKIYENKLKKEIDLFLLWKYDELQMNKWKNIAWTSIKLTNCDNNPYNTMEAHPDHEKQWVISWNWWEKTEEEWLKVYEKTFKLLKIVDIWIYDELNFIIKKIIPLGTSLSVHNSASYKECVWHLYLWYTINSSKPEMNNLEAIIHESSHNKLNLIMHFDKLILNNNEEKYYSAIRPDARHIHWILLGYHAFAPTMYIMMKAYLNWLLWNDIQWYEKIVLYYIKTKLLQKVFKKYAILTDLWKEINEEMDYIVTLMDDMFKKLNPSKEIINSAKEKQNQHFKNVNSNYYNLQY